MIIHALTVCVGYADLLEVGLRHWLGGVASLTVVTTPDGAEAIEPLQPRDASLAPRIYATDAFTRNGAAFDKASAMEDAIEWCVPWADWILLFDADIVPPADWLDQVKHFGPCPGVLYGAVRHIAPDPDSARSWLATGQPQLARMNEGELGGFFHLFHTSDPAVRARPLLGSWANASGYDSVFERRWPPDRKVRLPLRVAHLGEPGRNWCGRGNEAGMNQMWTERRKRGGWLHERLDHG